MSFAALLLLPSRAACLSESRKSMPASLEDRSNLWSAAIFAGKPANTGTAKVQSEVEAIACARIAGLASLLLELCSSTFRGDHFG
ncbi:MAG: hypothetical protein CAPSK01_003057 [Candidatus Accumulibacter vicinus]|uniref:Uncharacterized protein n=1 Tax=Candidatus Accumulibacter vicinus TaxID=2954382 RepID=A0A084XYS0_9PROT|nr:MAG: hypothetical protein CAPSK01_003057 [Candidatus Accumulibacter vicinus]